MGDGRTFDQAVRALDKLIVERTVVAHGIAPSTRVPDPDSPIRRAYERIVSEADRAAPGPLAA